MSDALRVLMVSDVSPWYPAGGGERMLWEQARRLAARGHDVRVVARADAEGGAPRFHEREDVRIRSFPVNRRSIAGFIMSSILGARRATSEELAQIQARLGVTKHSLTSWLSGIPAPEWMRAPNAKHALRARAVGLLACRTVS